MLICVLRPFVQVPTLRDTSLEFTEGTFQGTALFLLINRTELSTVGAKVGAAKKKSSVDPSGQPWAGGL